MVVSRLNATPLSVPVPCRTGLCSWPLGACGFEEDNIGAVDAADFMGPFGPCSKLYRDSLRTVLTEAKAAEEKLRSEPAARRATFLAVANETLLRERGRPLNPEEEELFLRLWDGLPTVAAGNMPDDEEEGAMHADDWFEEEPS